jgi:hypothetical protein
MSNPLLTASEQAHINAVRSYHRGGLDSTVSTLSALVDRVDWNKLFIRAAIALNAVGFLYVLSTFLFYAHYFGFSALAFLGQLMIGVFFLMTVWSTTDGLRVMIASIGMYILANSF